MSSRRAGALGYVLRRLASALPTLFIIVTAAFFLMRLAPGGPFDQEQALPPEVEANLRAAYGLDQPIHVQYLKYLRGLARGDLGPSFKFKDFSVSELIRQGLPVSATLGIAAMLLALAVGVPLGMLAALRHNRATDHVVMSFAVLGIVVPNFVVAPLLALIFGIHLGWLPVAGWGGGAIDHLILPVVTLALPFIAYVARLTRGSFLEVLRAPYIRTARAKGLSWSAILRRHAFKAAILPVVSFMGPALAGVMTGSLVVELAYSLPGIGRYFVQGAINRDYTLVMGVVVFYAALIVLFNLCVDLVYGWLDPRVRYD
jgi:oligopeptide transport system permease protein